jgi:hypothetical protein
MVQITGRVPVGFRNIRKGWKTAWLTHRVWALLTALAIGVLAALLSAAQTYISEDFATDPQQNGWSVLGDANLFQWDSINQNLHVTWDSSKSNSCFYHPLGTVLARDSDFSLSFDLRLDNIGAGADPAKNATFPIAVGFVNIDEMSRPGFERGTGSNSPDLVELAYFWDSGFGATLWPTVVSTNSTFNYNSAKDYAIFQLPPGDWYHFTMSFAASNQTVVTTATNFEQTAGVCITQLVNTNFTDFRVNVLSINSYSDAGQDTAFAGSVLAQGVIDNIQATVPPPPVQNTRGAFSNTVWQVEFESTPNWLFSLERSTDFQSWVLLPVSIKQAGATSVLMDTNPPPLKAFYRVRAQRP